MQLPERFCWSKFGTEAGEEILGIIERKEHERRQNGGVFLWGIGSALGPSIRLLLQVEPLPEVIFSPIKSSPRKIDVVPEKVARWTAARNLDGQNYALPSASKVTSRAKTGKSSRKHYALVCASNEALQLQRDLGEIELGQIRNLISNNPVGSSQVTAIVRRENSAPAYSDLIYSVAMRFRLVPPYFVELADPVIERAA